MGQVILKREQKVYAKSLYLLFIFAVNLIKTAVKKKKSVEEKKKRARKEGERERKEKEKRERGRERGRKGGKQIGRVGGRKMIDIVEFMWMENTASKCQESANISASEGPIWESLKTESFRLGCSSIYLSWLLGVVPFEAPTSPRSICLQTDFLCLLFSLTRSQMCEPFISLQLCGFFPAINQK